MKTCNRCQTPKDESEFNKSSTSKDGLRSLCKECTRTSGKKSYRKNSKYYIQKKTERRLEMKRMIIQIKEKNPCMDCKTKYPHYVMDFDHRDRSKKEFNISAQIHSKGMNQLLKEIEKCDIVCSNCHRERTHKQLSTSL